MDKEREESFEYKAWVYLGKCNKFGTERHLRLFEYPGYIGFELNGEEVLLDWDSASALFRRLNDLLEDK